MAQRPPAGPRVHVRIGRADQGADDAKRWHDGRPPPIASRISPTAQTPRSTVFDAPSGARSGGRKRIADRQPGAQRAFRTDEQNNAARPPRREPTRRAAQRRGKMRQRRQQPEQGRADRERQKQPRRGMQRQYGPMSFINGFDRRHVARAHGTDRKGEGAADDVAVERRDPPAHQVAPVRQAIRQRPEHLPVAHLRRAGRRTVLPRRIDQAQANSCTGSLNKSAMRSGAVALTDSAAGLALCSAACASAAAGLASSATRTSARSLTLVPSCASAPVGKAGPVSALSVRSP